MDELELFLVIMMILYGSSILVYLYDVRRKLMDLSKDIYSIKESQKVLQCLLEVARSITDDRR